ncbi:MAG TPA: PAS domain S-box protein [Caldithrix abyssi]|uniref:histidine kinase n=1 Tax=Caldithrix abyssi TaxID=187145 RepID=A0A7V4U0Q3_CALAY|nr:PAS domain S-box protein [Caldithrix abyssi]
MDFTNDANKSHISSSSPLNRPRTGEHSHLSMKSDFEHPHIYLNAILKNAPDIIYQLNPEGKITYINDTISGYGYRQSELIGQNIIDLVHPDDRDRAYYNIRERRSGERRTHSMEIRLLTKEQLRNLEKNNKLSTNGNGSRFFLLEAEGLYAEESQKNRQFLGTQGIARDITGNRRVVQELIRLRSVVEKMDAWVIITDAGGKISFASDAFLQDAEIQVERIEGRNLWDLNLIGEADTFIEQFKEIIERGSTEAEQQESIHYLEGYETSFFPVFDTSGKIISYAAIRQNRGFSTFSSAHLQKAQKMEAVGLMAGGIAHDFNNLLTVINGYAELILAQVPEKNPMYPYIQQILKGGQRARDMIRQLLAFSRKQIINPRIVQLNTIIKDNREILKRLVGADIDLEFQLSENLPPIKADPSQIEQIMLNLIVNARDAILDKRGRLPLKRILVETKSTVLDEKFASEHPGSKPGKYIRLSVSDTGKGIDEHTREKIFEPFFTTKSDGTGLGLATVYGIVKQNGGSIYVHSKPDTGTRFDIYWPSTRKQVETKPEESKEQPVLRGNETILLVEDDENVRSFTISALEMLGYTVLAAANGEQALQIVQKTKKAIDLLIADAVMPRMSGSELAEKLIKHMPSLQVLYTSGYTDNYIVKRGHLVKGVNFIEKPYTGNSLAQKIRSIFDKN